MSPGPKHTRKRPIPPRPEPIHLRTWQVVLGVLAVCGVGAWMMASPAVTHRRFDSHVWGFVITAIALAFAGVWFFRPTTNKPPEMAYAYDRMKMKRSAGKFLKGVMIGFMIAIALILVGLGFVLIWLVPELGRWGERNDSLVAISILFAAMLGGMGVTLYWQKPLIRRAVTYARPRAFSWRAADE